jgi:hypothetical protein
VTRPENGWEQQLPAVGCDEHDVIFLNSLGETGEIDDKSCRLEKTILVIGVYFLAQRSGKIF